MRYNKVVRLAVQCINFKISWIKILALLKKQYPNKKIEGNPYTENYANKKIAELQEAITILEGDKR